MARIRLTEQQLTNIIKMALREAEEEMNGKNYRFVEDLNAYIQQNGFQMRPVYKFQRIGVQNGRSYINQWGKRNNMDRRKVGRIIRRGMTVPTRTELDNGEYETSGNASANDFVVWNHNTPNNQWPIQGNTFRRKYERDPEMKGNIYKPKGGIMLAGGPVKENICFIAPWGSKEYLEVGGYILQDPVNKNDIYGISGPDFQNSYKFKDSVNEAIRRSVKRYLRSL